MSAQRVACSMCELLREALRGGTPPSSRDKQTAWAHFRIKHGASYRAYRVEN